MHNDTVIHGTTGAQKYAHTSRGNASAVGAKRKPAGFGALVAVAAAVLVLAGCGDGADTTAPTVSGVQFTATATTATITATVNEAGKLFWVAYTDGDAPADAAALIAAAGKDKAAPIVANSGSAGLAVSAAGMVTVAITGLTASSNYDFYAVAQDAAGNSSALSAKLDINTFLPAVTDLSAVAAGGGSTDIVLSWTLPATIPNDAAKLQLRYATTRAGLASATPVDIAATRADILTATTYTLTATLTSGTKYYFAVLIVNSTGGNALPLSGAGFTDSVSYVTTGTPNATLPGIPTGLDVAALAAGSGGVDVTVEWQNPVNAARIELSWTPATPAIGKETVDATASGSTQNATITLTDNTTYTISAVAINSSDARSSAARITNQRIDLAAPAMPTGVILTPVADGSIAVSWTASTSSDVAEYEVLWATTAGALPDSPLGRQAVAVSATSATTGVLTSGTTYHFVVLARDGANILGNKNTSSSATVNVVARIIIDSDGDTLIDISNLDMLNNVRCNLAGTAYLTANSSGVCATSGGLQCGAVGTTAVACTGYELMRNLDFATAGDYASGTVNTAWRPTTGGSTVVADTTTATNAGWVPIGTTFTGIFEGNGHAISNLYVRSSGNAGLFNTLEGAIRNLGVIDGAVYGTGSVGIVASATATTAAITAIYASGTANGGMGNGDRVGGLIGTGSAAITASYASATVNGGAGNGDQVGGLVGNNGGVIIASYASGNADGGAGTGDKVGGLAGLHTAGGITASYASGNANGGAGANDLVGGLVGSTEGFSDITASYASGTAKGGDDGNDTAGALVGTFSGFASAARVSASYGFNTTEAENTGFTGSAPAPASALVVVSSNAAGWSTAAGGAWNFGTATQAPAVKYADYDGAGSGTDYCALFSDNVPGTATPIVCGTTLLPGQGR